MFEEKESFWKKKGFYLSVCTVLVCGMAIGTVYYKMNYDNQNQTNLFADTATAEPERTSEAAGAGAIDIAENSQNVIEDDNNSSDTQVKSQKAEKKEVKSKEKKSSDSNEKSETKSTSEPSENETKVADNSQKAVTAMSDGSKYVFNAEKGLRWPVKGDVILKYSMTNTVYFKTLAQYKCNPAIAIAAEVGTSVKAAASGVVTKISNSADIGKNVTVDIGSGYKVVYGQLNGVSVKKGQEIKAGQVIGKIAEPTKYYVEEGSNLYFKVTEKGTAVDPLLLLQ